MRISGFTLVRNGAVFDYPFIESIQSLLPLVDEFIINVGIGDDNTLSLIQQLAKTHTKIQVFESNWDTGNPENKKGGKVLSQQTNAALERCTGDWCIYLQADEVLHELDLPQIRSTLENANSHTNVEGLVFDYLHFYGSFDVVQHSRSTYRREVRAVRKSAQPRSVGDAQSFRKKDGTKLSVVSSGARIFHYGWVRDPKAMKEKTYFMDQLYHGEPKDEDRADHTPHTGNNYQYKKFWGLSYFKGDHPTVMRDRIRSKGWHWDLDHSPWIWHWKDAKKVVLDTIERITGFRFFEYRSYRLLKSPFSHRNRLE